MITRLKELLIQFTVCVLNELLSFYTCYFSFCFEGGLWIWLYWFLVMADFFVLTDWPEYTPPDKRQLPFLCSVNRLISCTDMIHLQDCVHMSTFYCLLLWNSCNSNTCIIHYGHFTMHLVTMTLHMPKHMRQYLSLLPSVYWLLFYWLLCALFFSWLLIKGSSFDLVSHVDGKHMHKKMQCMDTK